MNHHHLYPGNSFSASVLAAQAAGLQPSPLAVKTANTVVCAMCGRHVQPGDHVHHTDLAESKTFNDGASMARQDGSQLVCWQCVAISGKVFLQALSKSLITPSGFYKLASNADQASLLLSPPREPFVAILSDTTQQHLIWRTPVNYSDERITLRLSNQLLTVRRPYVLRAYQSQKHILAEALARKLVTKAASGVWYGVDRELKHTTNPATAKADALRGIPELAPHFEALDALSHAETWALAILSSARIEEPQDLVQATSPSQGLIPKDQRKSVPILRAHWDESRARKESASQAV